MNVMIIDTETAGSIGFPLPYDVGYEIIDTATKEVKCSRSYVVAEIFLDKDLMSSAYYAEKVPQYWEDIKSGKRKMMKYNNIRFQILKDLKEFDCNKVGAYNMRFDDRATKNDAKKILNLWWFFPKRVQFFDIWTMACTSILRSKRFIDWALKNNCVSPSGNIRTNAETAYQYITKNLDFTESHTGLEDVEIEKEIFFAVLRSRMIYEENIIGSPWRIPQEYYAELYL